MATVDRVARQSLALRRTVGKVQGIRAGERTKIRSKRTGVSGKTGVWGSCYTNTTTGTSVVRSFILADCFLRLGSGKGP